MTGILGTNSYGKSRVRVMRVVRTAARHELSELDVAIQLAGDFTAAHETGDNAKILPTDTMKNTAYALAALAPGGVVEQPEDYALRFVEHLLGSGPQIESATVTCVERRWSRLVIDGAEHDHAFEHDANGGTRTCVAYGDRDGARSVHAGIRDLLVLKSTESGFEGYIVDQYTTLPPTNDRIFATSMDILWAYTDAAAAVRAAAPSPAWLADWTSVRDAVLRAFATGYSASVQQTGLLAGQAALAAVPAIERISFGLPNKHFLPFDLTRLGLENRNEIFIATDEPHGQINLTVVRD